VQSSREARRGALQIHETELRFLESKILHVEQVLALQIRWETELIAKAAALPSRDFTDRDRGRRENLQLSIRALHDGPMFGAEGMSYETSEIGALVRRDCPELVHPLVNNQAVNELSWPGTIGESKSQLADLRQRHVDALVHLKDALEDPATLHARWAAVAAERNAQPRRKIFGDGTVIDTQADGTIVEISGPPPPVNASLPIMTERQPPSVVG
jgi:hypothetical protein